jgi:hypothetical protein
MMKAAPTGIKLLMLDESYLEYNLEANDWVSLMYDSLNLHHHTRTKKYSR